MLEVLLHDLEVLQVVYKVVAQAAAVPVVCVQVADEQVHPPVDQQVAVDLEEIIMMMQDPV
jgi:hypothetical protein